VSAALIGRLLSARYRLDSKLGSGGMSTVYLANDETLERPVALKVMHREISDQQDQIERFRREALAVAKLSHPNVVSVIDAGEDDGHPYIVFEYVDGETLKDRIERLGPLPLDETAAYGIEIGRGLAAAHSRGLVHRDVKPQNVLIDGDGRAKVTDFGIARNLDAHGLTATGRVLGTTDYVSPEQAMGKDVDARSDIYSLGVVLYEMLTGDVPFLAETQVGVAMKHVNDSLPEIQQRRADVSSAMGAVLDRSTAKHPDNRYADMPALLSDLEGALEVEVARAGSSTGEATTVLDSVPGKRRRLLTRNQMSWAGVALVGALAAGAIAFAALTGDEGPSRQPVAGALPITIDSATDFDPEGGDGELPDSVELAVDGSPTTTAWTTEQYTTDVLGGLKEGVGIFVEANAAGEPNAMLVRTAIGGWNGEVYASALSPPSELAGWGAPVGTVTSAATEQEIPLTVTQPSRYFLLWFTTLAPSTDNPDQFRVEVGDIRLLS